jgi:hypothetical protein
MSESKMIYLMADDDVVLAGFLEVVEFLKSEYYTAAVYGETFSFQIQEGFEPFGTLDFIRESKPNPEVAWLEDDSVYDRLSELSRRPLSTVGWYAVHRRDAFEDLVSIAQTPSCSKLDFEFILNVAQPIIGKVVKLQVPFLARQINQTDVPRIGKRITDYRDYSDPLIEVGVDLLVIRHSLENQEARTLLSDVLEKDRVEMESFSWRRLKFVNLVLSRFQFLNSVIRFLRRGKQNRFTVPDMRFQSASDRSIKEAFNFVLENTSSAYRPNSSD